MPLFFTDSEVSKQYQEIGEFYDELYGTMADSWKQLASRGIEFTRFVASIAEEYQPDRYLDIGCGEGHLLKAVDAKKKYGIDISIEALHVAADNCSNAELCVGFSEQLPYPNEYFDVVSSIGVMTHFIDDLAATLDINRVMKPQGHYLLGLFLRPLLAERVLSKVSEFVLPRPKPFDFIRWVIRKSSSVCQVYRQTTGQRDEHQPIERYYTTKDLEDVFEKSGFKIIELITKRKRPDAPLAGHHFRIYILKKQ